MATDPELVARVLGGEPAAFGALVERYRDALVGFCFGRTGDWWEAHDLAQEAFLRAYFDLHSLRDPARFGPWVRAVALRLCQSWHRRRREIPLPPEVLAGHTAPASRDESAESLARLVAAQALGALPEAQRQAFGLKHLQGYTVPEIAAMLAVPAETIRTRLRRARHHLKEAWLAMMEEGAQPLSNSTEVHSRNARPEPLPAGRRRAHFVRTSMSSYLAGLTRRVLDRLEIAQMESGLTWPIYACLHALGKDWTLSYLMGAMGDAFRLTVDDQVDDSGPTHVLDWDRWFARIHQLGCEVTVFNAQLKSFPPAVPANTEEEFRAAQAAGWDAVRGSVDRGVPAIAWMPMTAEQKAEGQGCEFGLLVGYDTDAGTYQVRLPSTPAYSVPWDGFGRADPANWFNAIVFGAEQPLDERALEREALQYAVDHTRSARAGHGLNGYDTWLAALQSGRIQPNGSPRQARIVREARESAAAFLREIDGRFSPADADLRRAGGHYRQVARAWEGYLQAFPPDIAGAAKDPARCAAGEAALREARDSEEQAVAALERALIRLQP